MDSRPGAVPWVPASCPSHILCVRVLLCWAGCSAEGWPAAQSVIIVTRNVRRRTQ